MKKNIIIYLISALLLFQFSVSGQDFASKIAPLPYPSELTPPLPPNEYHITITIENLPDDYLFLVAHSGNQKFIIDSAKVKKGKTAIFQNDVKKSKKGIFCGLYSGIYTIQNREGKEYFDLLIDKSRNFSVYTLYESIWTSYQISNSEENIIFFEYQKYINFEDVTIDNLYAFIETAPQSLLSKYISALLPNNEIPDFTLDGHDTTWLSAEDKYKLFTRNYFNHIDLQDERLLRTPLVLDLKTFFTEIVFPNSDSIIHEIDRFMDKIISPSHRNLLIESHYLREIYKIFDVDNPDYDAVLVHLYDKYCPYPFNTEKENDYCWWLNYSEARRYGKSVERKRRVLPGEDVPALACYNIDKQLISLDSITNDYLILWFWDPDCEHCLEVTPQLKQFYDEYREFYNLEVFAVSVTEDYDRWYNFSTQHQLNWINLSYAMGEPNYDFIDYYDILTTPVIYLLDKNHKIIARQFSLEEIHEIISKGNITE